MFDFNDSMESSWQTSFSQCYSSNSMESSWQTSFSLCDSRDSMELSWQTSFLLSDFNNLLGDSNDSMESSGYGLSRAFLMVLRVYNFLES